MDKDYFMNTGISQWTELNCAADQSFYENSSDHRYPHFNSSLSSGLSDDAFVLRELIGKFGGGFGSSDTFSAVAASAEAENSNFSNSTNHCSSLASHKLNLPIIDQMNIPNLGNSVTLTPPLPTLVSDPGFAERAAKFSCLGSRSFSGRTSQLVLNCSELGIRSSSNPMMGNGKLSRVSSSPALKQGGPLNRNLSMEISRQPGNNNEVVLGSEKKLSKLSGSNANSSNEESSVSEQIPSGDTGSKISNGMNPRKRKVVSRGKSKGDGSNSAKGVEWGENENSKRSKPTENGKIETKTEETREGSNDESEKQTANQKPPEPPKDYIHVRARRGQATDSHSLAERVRREKISERMKLLQDLVPGCNKVTGKALMLDEIINYVQSLQCQVEFLSMKLASVNPGLDFNMENLLSKDTFQQNAITLPQQMYPLDSSSPAFYHQQNVQQLQHNSTNISSGPMGQCPVDPLPMGGGPNSGIHLPCDDGFTESLHQQFPSFSEDDLQSIVQMGLVQNPVNFQVINQTTNMKVER
ncbi:hypothetical protein OROGR_022219 [Orobanche gracilis]